MNKDLNDFWKEQYINSLEIRKIQPIQKNLTEQEEQDLLEEYRLMDKDNLKDYWRGGSAGMFFKK